MVPPQPAGLFYGFCLQLANGSFTFSVLNPIMKKNYCFLALLLIFAHTLTAQPEPIIQWQKCLGGSQNDYTGRIVRSADGGYVVASITTSQDGDVIPHTGNLNIWVVKFSNTGSIIWQKCLAGGGAAIGGGSTMNFCLDIKNTPDGGYVLASTTNSNAAFAGYHAGLDALIIKLSRDGTPQWQRCYGGSQIDAASAIQTTTDGGYIFLGETSSSDGDVLGLHGGMDIWAVKIDKAGNIQWQKCLGGSADDYTAFKSFSNGGGIQQTTDKGYILIGSTSSTNGDVSGAHGSAGYINDIWVVKLDSAGNKLWQKTLGGTQIDEGNDIVQAPDGNYMALATTLSSDGDVTNNHRSGSPDIWMIKLSEQGSIIWQKCFGGSGPVGERAIRIKNSLDGNFIIGGAAGSDDGDVSGVHRSPTGFQVQDAWLVKVNNTGDMLWQKAFGGFNIDDVSDFCQTEDNEIAFTAYTMSGSDGDIIGSHNPTNIQSQTLDVWVVKTGSINTIKGSVFIDYNGNGLKDGNDSWVKNALVKSEKAGYNWQSFVNNGVFSNKVDTGTFVTGLILHKPYYNVIPLSKQTTFTAFFTTDSIGFSLSPIPNKKDYLLNLLPITPLRPGFYSSYKIKLENQGTDTLTDKTVQLVKDSRAVFQYSTPLPASVSGDTITWNVTTLLPSDSGSINITFLNSSSEIHIGDTLKFVAGIDTTGDLATSDNVSVLRQVVTGGYDPNDKQENAGGFITPDDLKTAFNFTYTIRFQNTGNDTAFNIIIRDTLDANTDWSSIKMIDASHPYRLSIKNDRYSTWQFNNINRVDSMHNEPLSHGYITYSIRPKSTLVLGDSIRNSASIYFDFNSPVKTNTQLTIVKQAIPAPAIPVVTGIQTGYCSIKGPQKGKIANLPLPGSETTAIVKLDAAVLPVGADSSFSFNASAMAAGAHVLVITFTNNSGSKATTIHFSIVQAVMPAVQLSASTGNVTNLTDPVVITAANAAGGGVSPTFSFAKDRGFSNILQAESSSNTLTIQPNTLTVGSNWVFVKMKTSDTCYIAKTGIDSITIERSAVTGLIDLDFPGQVINIYPNPFSNSIQITGLNAGKTYSITISNAAGQSVHRQQVSNSSRVTITKSGLQTGKYWLSMYDYKKHLLIGTVALIKE